MKKLPEMLRAILLCGLVMGVLPGETLAQEGPATGFATWVRIPVNGIRQTAASLAANPEFAVGYRGESFGIGAALGFTTIRYSEGDYSVTGTVWQIGPAGWLDIWHSDDGNTRGNLSLGVTFGRASLTEEDLGFKSEGSGTLVNFNLGLGGDHFLGQHFALGVEGGFQGSFALDLKEEGDVSESTLSASGLYGMIRTMVVF